MSSTDIAQRTSRLPAAGWIESVLIGLGIRGRTLVIAIPFIWLFLFFFLPFLIVLWVSTSFVVIAQPPYNHVCPGGSGFCLNISDSFGRLWPLNDWLYIKSYVNSLVVAAVSTILCLVIGYPLAYGMA